MEVVGLVPVTSLMCALSCMDLDKRPFLHVLAYPVSGQGHFSRRKDLSPKHIQPNITFTKALSHVCLARQTDAFTKTYELDKACRNVCSKAVQLSRPCPKDMLAMD